MEKRARFESRWLPYALIAPQMAITLIFFFLPASQALYQSVFVQDAFGASTQFVWFENFEDLFRNEEYLASFKVKAIFFSSSPCLDCQSLSCSRSSPIGSSVAQRSTRRC